MRKHKYIIILALAMITISFSACSTSDTNTESSETETSSSEIAHNKTSTNLPPKSNSKSNVNDNNNEASESKTTIQDPTPDIPADTELSAYAQTVLKDFYPNAKFSIRNSDYNFIRTDLRYKIEGYFQESKDASDEQFALIIQFTDDSYTVYDLLYLQVGKDTIFNDPDAGSDLISTDNDGILSEENAKIYNEVMNKLDAEPDRDEDDIFSEIAPDYGMTASELHDFMLEYMEAYYQQ